MKSFSGLYAISGLLSSVFAASNGHVFLIDSASPRPAAHHDTIDPQTSQLIFAQRLGLSTFFDLPTDAETLSRLNKFGGQAQSLLRTNRHHESSARIMVVIENVDKPIDLVPVSEHIRFFDVAPAPHPSDTVALVQDFTVQADKLRTTNTAVDAPKALQALTEDPEFSTTVTSRGSRFIVHDKTLEGLSVGSTEYSSIITKLKGALSGIAKMDAAEFESITVVLMPSAQQSAERSSTKSYKFAKRSAETRQADLETPLADTKSRIIVSSSSSDADSIENVFASALPKGPIPSCFASQSACEKSTNNCTGHGECIKRAGKETKDDQACWGCACKPQVRKNKDGSTKTTRYAGGACSKKDVSMEFWLLGGTSVFIMFLISWGLGLLYTMGNQDLPSVIGAGVTGPRATR